MKEQKKTDWSSWLDQLGTELYNSTDAYQKALPELADLHQHGKEYLSSYKLNGSRARGGRKDKTYIRKVTPLIVHEHGDVAKNLIKYIEQRDNKPFRDVVKELAGYVGMELPPDDDDGTEWKQKQAKKEMLATIQEYYQWCLHNADGAEPQRQYLLQRFTAAEIDAMGLGYIPSKVQLKDYLLKYYGTDEVVDLLMHLNDKIGSTHHITIPIYRAGSVYGWIYRHHNQPEAEGLKKYQYQKRLDGEPQTNLQFDFIPATLRNDGALVVVEGQLDAAHLLAAGIHNVVSTGTNAVNPEQVRDAVKRGCRSITLMYDADPTDEEPDKNYTSVHKATATIRETLQGMGKDDEVRLYVAVLPQTDPTQKVDPDSYLQQNGAEAVTRLIAQANAVWHYELEHLTEQYTGHDLNEKELAAYTDGMLAIYETISSPIEQQTFRNVMADWLQGVDAATLDKMLADHREKAAAAQAQKEAAELMKQATELMQKGDVAGALKLQNKATLIATAADADREYEQMREPTTRTRVVEGLQAIPEAVHTGLHIGGSGDEHEIMLPAGALSVLAAPTSHGKTTMLVSMAVNAAKKDPSKQYYLLSYEEALAPITAKALNCYAGLELTESNRTDIEAYLKTGRMKGYSEHPEKWELFREREKQFFDMMEQGRLHICYTDAYCETLCRNIRRLAEDCKLGAVFVDYVQYLELANVQSTYSRQEQIGRICRMLKDVAVDTGTPIVLGAQFNREVVDPLTIALSNIGEGGEIERKAGYVLGFWNNDMRYTSKAGNQLTEDRLGRIAQLTKGAVYDAERKNKSIYVSVLKNRSGIGAKAGDDGLLAFDGNIGSVEDRDGGRTAATTKSKDLLY